jgi:hypothetical protein
MTEKINHDTLQALKHDTLQALKIAFTYMPKTIEINPEGQTSFELLKSGQTHRPAPTDS